MYDYLNIAPAYPSEPTPDMKDIVILRNVNIMANNNSWHSCTEKPMSTCTLVELYSPLWDGVFALVAPTQVRTDNNNAH